MLRKNVMPDSLEEEIELNLKSEERIICLTMVSEATNKHLKAYGVGRNLLSKLNNNVGGFSMMELEFLYTHLSMDSMMLNKDGKNKKMKIRDKVIEAIDKKG